MALTCWTQAPKKNKKTWTPTDTKTQSGQGVSAQPEKEKTKSMEKWEQEKEEKPVRRWTVVRKKGTDYIVRPCAFCQLPLKSDTHRKLGYMRTVHIRCMWQNCKRKRYEYRLENGWKGGLSGWTGYLSHKKNLKKKGR